MDFHVGDPVMHWTYGLGQITQLEERAVSGKNTLYLRRSNSRHDRVGTGG